MRGRPTPFVVLTSPRTGSAWLVDTLNDHPAIAAYPELFLPEATGMPDYASSDVPYFHGFLERVRPFPGRGRRLRLFGYLGSLYAGRAGVGAVGFKLMYGQVHANPGLLPYFALRRVRVLHLIRANLFRAVLSYDVAKSTGVFHARRGDALPSTILRLDPADLIERLEQREEAVTLARRWVERYRLPYLEVSYEGMCDRREETLSRILRFLGVEPSEDRLDSAFARINSVPLSELIENLYDVRGVLAGTRFEWMLEAAERGSMRTVAAGVTDPDAASLAEPTRRVSK